MFHHARILCESRTAQTESKYTDVHVPAKNPVSELTG